MFDKEANGFITVQYLMEVAFYGNYQNYNLTKVMQNMGDILSFEEVQVNIFFGHFVNKSIIRRWWVRLMQREMDS